MKKLNKLNTIISLYFPSYNEQETFEKNNFRTELNLPDGGIVSIGLDAKTRRCSEFLHFNIRGSEIRLKDSGRNGKINKFGDECVPKLNEYLTELKNIIG